MLERLHQQIVATGDPALQALHHELVAYPVPTPSPDAARLEDEFAGIVVPFQIVTEVGLLSLISTTTIFGTPVDVTLQELAVESFFPADMRTSAALVSMAT